MALRVRDDDLGVSTISTAVVTVNNVAPTGNSGGPYSGDEGAAIVYSGNATDPGTADILTCEWDFDYNGSTFTADASGVDLIHPLHTYLVAGGYTVALRVIDSDGAASFLSMAAVTVAPANTAPVAADDGYSTDEDIARIVAVPGVLGNDDDADANPLTAVLVSDVSTGTLALNADGSFTYTPNEDFNGSDSFTYKANDGATDSNVATVSITVNPMNDAPNAVNDSVTVANGDTVTVLDSGQSSVLANDSDPEGDLLSVTTIPVSGPSNGSLTLNANGTFSYTHDGSVTSSDSFIYQVCDNGTPSGCGTATVSITVTAYTGSTASVASLTDGSQGGKDGKKHLLMTAALVDNSGGTVGGASVSIVWFLVGNSSPVDTGTGTTGADGGVTFMLKHAPSGCYTVMVTDVTAAGLSWVSEDPANTSGQFCK